MIWHVFELVCIISLFERQGWVQIIEPHLDENNKFFSFSFLLSLSVDNLMAAGKKIYARGYATRYYS